MVPLYSSDWLTALDWVSHNITEYHCTEQAATQAGVNCSQEAQMVSVAFAFAFVPF